MENITPMMGAFDNSEHDYLMEKIGKPLHRAVSEAYEKLMPEGIPQLLAQTNSEKSPMLQLITLCQRAIVFDAFARSADINAVSTNGGGFNAASSDGYDTASTDMVKAFKAQCGKEAHAATNRLLVQLEEWAQEVAGTQTEESDGTAQEKQEIVSLWEQSKYYYWQQGLLLNTATALSEFLDIYESRERFIQFLPDLRHIQEVILAEEVGDELMEDLTRKATKSAGNESEKKAVRLLRRAMALHLEDRNKFFKRELAHDEALQATKVARDFIAAHLSDFDADAVLHSPFEISAPSAPAKSGWKNNRKGNTIFVTKPLF